MQQERHFILRQVALLLIGLLIVVVTIGAATAIGIRTLSDNYDRLEFIVNESASQSALLNTMQEVIRERMLLVYDIIQTDDPFTIDELFIAYSETAGRFIQARERLLQHNLTPQQRQQVARQRDTLLRAQTILDQIVANAHDGVPTGSNRQILEARRANGKVLAELAEMARVQEALLQQSLQAASSAYSRSRNQILGLLFAAFTISITVGIFIISRIVTQGRDLKRALAALEESNTTLESRVRERTDELMSARAENLRMGTELDVSRRLQQMLLPRSEELSRIDDLEIACYMEPAYEIGGDYYDILHNGKHVVIGIGDVTGHGLESGVIMLMVQSAVRSLIDEGDAIDLSRALNRINRVIYQNCQRMGSDKNLTLALIHYCDGRLEISGQHEELLLMRNGKIERIDTIELGFPIGLEQTIDEFIGRYQTTLEPGDRAILFTDGLIEAENPEGELYGLPALCETLELHHLMPPNELVTTVIHSVREHMGDRPLLDDLSLLVIQRR